MNLASAFLTRVMGAMPFSLTSKRDNKSVAVRYLVTMDFSRLVLPIHARSPPAMNIPKQFASPTIAMAVARSSSIPMVDVFVFRREKEEEYLVN